MSEPLAESTTDMIERAARSAYEAYSAGRTHTPWDECSPEFRGHWRRMASVAVAASLGRTYAEEEGPDA